MRDYRDAKPMARRLRQALAEKGLALTHADSLELIARSFGLRDWNVLAAMIAADGPAPPTAQPAATWSGPLLALRDVVAFPKLSFPLFIGRERSKRALANAFRDELEVFLVAQRDPADNDPSLEQLYPTGVIADVLERLTVPDGSVKLLVRGRERARLLAISEQDGLRRAEVALTPSVRPGKAADGSLLAAAAAFQAYAATQKNFSDATKTLVAETAHPGVMADLIAAHARASVARKQTVLEMLDPRPRLQAAVRLISGPDAQAAA